VSLEPRLEIEVIWKDVHMIELGVTTCNGYYSGTTQVYTAGKYLVDFAGSLVGFPEGREQTLYFEAGEQDSYGYFSIRLYCLDALCHTAAQIKLEREATTLRSKSRDKLDLELLFEPSSLDMFREQLLEVGRTEAGRAVLVGYLAV